MLNLKNIETIFKATPVPCLILLPDSPKYTVAGCNNSFEALTGISEAELVARGLWEIFPDDHARFGGAPVKNAKLALERSVSKKKLSKAPIIKITCPADENGASDEKYIHPEFCPVVNEAGEIDFIIHYAQDVTDKSIAELQEKAMLKELASSRQHYQSLFANSPNGIYSLDEHGRIISANNSLALLMECPAAELLQKGIERFFVPAQKNLFKESIHAAIAGNIHQYNTQIETLTGKKKELSVTNLPIEVDGRVTGAFGIIRDITLKKEIERELLLSEQKYRSIIDNSLYGFLLTDPENGVVLEANATALQMFGYTLEEFKRLKRTDLFDSERPELGKLLSIRHSEGQARGEVYAMRKNGEHFPCEFSSVLFVDINGNARSSTIIIDISSKKAAAEEKEKNDRRFRAFIEHSEDMITIMDQQFKISYVSPAFEKVLGYKAEELGSTNFKMMHPDEVEESRLSASQVLNNPGVPIARSNRLLHKNGHYVSVEGTIINLLNDKNVQAIISNYRDVTVRKQAEGRIRESEANLRAIFDNSIEGLCLVDTSGIIKAFNSKARESIMLNVTPIEVRAGELIFSYIAPDRVAMFKALMQKVIEGEVVEYDLSFEQAEGHVLWLHFSLYPVKEKEAVTGICIAVSDISARKATEELIRNNEQHYRYLFYKNPLPMWIFAPGSLRFLEVNDSAIAKYGYSREEFLQLTLKDIRPVTDIEQMLQSVNNRVAGDDGLTRVWKHVKKNGEEIEVDISSHQIEYQGQSAVLVLANDITARIRAEQQKEFERRDKEALINSTDDLIWSVDRDFKLIAANNAFIHSVQWSTGVTVEPGSELLMKDRYEKGYIAFWYTLYARALEGEQFKEEISLDNFKGEKAWVEISFNPIHQNNLIVGIACYGRNITENKNFQSQILAINKKLETAQQLVGLGYWEMDLATDQIFWSDEVYKIWGVAKEEAGPHFFNNLNDTIHPDDREAFNADVAATLRAEKNHDIEHRIILPDGSIRYVHEKGGLVSDSSGKPVRLEGTVLDITDRKEAEKALKGSEEKYKMIFNDSPLPKWIYELSSLSILEVNKATVAHYGYTRDELLQMTIKDIRPPEDVDSLAADITEKYKNKGIIDFGRWRHIKKSGELIWVEVAGHAIEYNGKDCMMVVTNDVTRTIKANEALRKSNERFEYVTKATSDAIWDWDLTNDDLFWGEGFSSLFGYDLSEIEVNVGSWYAHIHPDDKERITNSIDAVTKSTTETYWQDEYRYKRADGSYANVMDRGLVVRNEEGKAYRMIGAMQDISAIKQNELNLYNLNEKLNKRAHELAVSNAELEQFAYVASHDLQEPLRMVTSFLSQLEKKYKGQLDDKAQKYIWFAVDGAVRMRKIILDLLEYSRVGRKQYELEKINMNELLADVLQLNNTLIEETSTLVQAEELPTITAAKTPLQQVMQNLVTNALKYQMAGQQPVIRISSKEFQDHWQFAVSDNGIGIDPQFYDKIFILFQRLHNKDEYTGTGIGLAICKKIVEGFKGSIWVDSVVGQGSTFYFTISKTLT